MADTRFDNVVRGHSGDISTLKGKGAAARPQNAADCSQQRALAGTVRAYDRYNLARLHRERDIVEGLNRPVVDIDVSWVEKSFW